MSTYFKPIMLDINSLSLTWTLLCVGSRTTAESGLGDSQDPNVRGGDGTYPTYPKKASTIISNERK